MNSALVVDLIKGLGYDSVGVMFGYDDDRDYIISVLQNGGRVMYNNAIEEHLYQVKYQSEDFLQGEIKVKELADKLKFITHREIKKNISGTETLGNATVSLMTLPQFGGKIGSKYQWFLGVLIREIRDGRE